MAPGRIQAMRVEDAGVAAPISSPVAPSLVYDRRRHRTLRARRAGDGDPTRRRAARRPARGSGGQLPQVPSFGLAQPQCLGDRVQDVRGGLGLPLLQPCVVDFAHPGEPGQFLAPQPRHATAFAVRHHAEVLGPQLRAARPQELTQLSFPSMRRVLGSSVRANHTLIGIPEAQRSVKSPGP